VEDPNPVPGTQSLDLRLVRVNQDPYPTLKPIEGPIRRTREGGSEWEPIKLLLEEDEGSNKMNKASNTRLRLTTQVGQDHAAIVVLLALGTNNQPYRPDNTAEHKP
jgi:hypothetical protein